MANLPFVVQPKRKPVKYRVGNEESGVVEINRRGYLTVAEKSFVQGAMAGDETSSRLHVLVRKIVQETGVPYERVFDEITDPNQEYLEPYNEEILACVHGMQNYNNRMAIVTSTALLVNRVDTEWTVEDTLGLHPDILEGLHELYQMEDEKSLDGFEEERTEEDQVRSAEGKDSAKE